MKLRDWLAPVPMYLAMLLLLLGWLPALALGQTSAVVLDGNDSRLDLTPYLSIHYDPQARLDLAGAMAAPFQAATTSLLRPGYTQDALWLKLELHNTSAAPLMRMLSIDPARLQEATLYIQRDGHWQRLDAGTNQPFAQHPVMAVNPVFPLVLAAHSSSVIYLRIASETGITLTATLWEPSAFNAANNRKTILDCLFLGGLALTALYSLLMFVTLRKHTFALLGGTVLSYCLFETSFNGYASLYLWPHATTWSSRSILVFGFITAVGFMSFMRDLIGTARLLPRWDRVLQALLVVLLLFFCCIPLVSHRWLAQWGTALGTLMLCSVLVTTVLTLKLRLNSARYYLLALCVALVGNMVRNLIVFGLIDASNLLSYIRPLYMLICFLFLLTAVVENVARARREKESAQHALLSAYSDYQAKLEREVAQRTADLHAALREIQGGNQARSQMLAYISHDLRAPLATIINYVHLLNRDASPQARQYQSTIEQSAKHQMELIDDLVDYARGELEQLQLELQPTYLHAWLDSISSQAELLSTQFRNTFYADLDAGLPAIVQIDPKRLRQVLLNLLSNAAKFTRGGYITFAVTRNSQLIGAAPQVGLRFSVHDTGPGIASHELSRIFQPFERLQSEQPGSGLGLSIARQLVRAMGGELEVRSEPGQGSRFTFDLLLDTAPESAVLLPAQAHVGQDDFGRGKRILLVDDDAANLVYMREMLGAADFDVSTAANGEEALQRLQGSRFDAVLTDQFMPRMDGWSLLQHVRTQFPQLPVLLCSAMPPQRPAADSMRWHFDASLFKPVAAEHLFNCLRQAMAQQDVPASTALAPLLPLLPAELAALLQHYIELGSITEIEYLAEDLARDYPELSPLAGQLRDAARRIDFAGLEALLAANTPMTAIPPLPDSTVS